MLDPVKQIHQFYNRKRINLDISFRCTLKCYRCNRQNEYKNIRPVPGEDLSVPNFIKICNAFDDITLCGQISDPIFNPNLLNFIKICKERNKILRVMTAASQKPESWYKKMFSEFGRGEWIFGIDGLPKDSHIHRVNQDGQKLFNMAKLCVSYGIRSRWSYIVFKYNENDIEEAKKLAKKYGISFYLNISSRFTKHDPLKPINPAYYVNKEKYI